MPTVGGKQYPYTAAGKRAAAAARRAKGGSVAPQVQPNPRAKNPDEIKTKADLLAGNLGNTIKNMGYKGRRVSPCLPQPLK